MRVVFIVQGEGRGHLTQALAVRSMLNRAGHEVACVLIGSVSNRQIPAFVVDKIQAPIVTFRSPGFQTGSDRRAIRHLGTLIENIGRAPEFKRSIKRIDDTVHKYRPDLIVVFYEPLGGLYGALYKPEAPIVAVGHQYMVEHSAYKFAPGRRVDRAALTTFTRITALRAVRKLALSLYRAPNQPGSGLIVTPPLLRDEALDRAAVPDVTTSHGRGDDFFLIYLLNRGYADQVVDWHRGNPQRRLHCFWDDPDAPDELEFDDTLTFHRLHDTKFLDLMTRCRGVVCTAGFESVSEAMYLGKPLMVVPVEGHYEQRCNAGEVEMLEVGIQAETFNLDLLEAFLPRYRPATDAFRNWVDTAEEKVMGVLEEVMREKVEPVPQALES